jgi:phosphoribosylformylglycinamidine synthase
MTQKYHARIYVTLRKSVLDPAGTAVESGLHQLGYQGVQQVRIGKYIELTLQASDQDTAKQQLDQMCDQLLANPVIENYCFELTPMEG